MSEHINNREYRQQILKDLITELHNGKSVDEVKEKFQELIKGVSASEISEMEQNLISEGMPIEEVQRLCDVHSAVFKGSIEEIHSATSLMNTPGHPLHTFKVENEAIEQLINDTVLKNIENIKEGASGKQEDLLLQDFNMLWDLDKHYKRKENLLFPYLEKYGITAPPKVMWGVDDSIRDGIKEVKKMIVDNTGSNREIVQKANKVIDKIKEMIFKEHNILFPMAVDTLTEDEWLAIEGESDELGYCLVGPQGKWKPLNENIQSKEENQNVQAYVKFETGSLSFKEISCIFNTLPIDITYIDKDDMVKYFTQGERVFTRTKAIIGRSVENCHPPTSVAVVTQMLEDFKSGEKENEDFWLRMGDLYIYIRYFAVRDENGKYLGTMEVTQNIQPLQEIQGEKRLLSDGNMNS